MGVGAVTGAIAGAAFGDHNGSAATGAALGTAVGALAGASIGSQIDEDIARTEALVEQRMGHRLSAAVTVEDVIAMTNAGLSDDVIATHVRAKGVARPMEVQDLIVLRNEGVTDSVIKTLQQAPPAQFVSSRPPVRQRPIVVEEHYYSPAVRVAPYHHRHRHHSYPRHRRQGASFGIHYSN